MKLIPTLILCITFGGVYWLNYKKHRVGFLILGISALCWCGWNLSIGENEQAIRTGGSGVLSVLTYFWWRSK